MKALEWITSIAALVAFSSAAPRVIHVGGIFDTEEKEMQSAFQVAVDHLNEDLEILPNSRIVASLERLPAENTFEATQLTCGLLKKGVAAIVGPQTKLISMHVQSICDDLEVPFIKSRWEYKMRRDQLSVNLYPHPTVLTSAFTRLLEIWGWKTFFYVYEDDEAVVRMKDFLVEGEKRKWNIERYKFANASSYRSTFWEIKQISKKNKTLVTEHNIVLDVSREHLFDVLKAAQQVGMMTELQKYLITSLDLHTIDMEDFQYGKTNISGLKLVQDTKDFDDVLTDVNSRRNGYEIPLKTLKTETALIYDSIRLLAYTLEQMDSVKTISVVPPISCNLMNKGIDGTTLINFMKNIKLPTPGLTGMIEFDAEGFRSRVSLDIMQLTDRGLEKTGTIFHGNEVKLLPTAPDDSEFQYFRWQKKHFEVTTQNTPPFFFLRQSPEQKAGNDRYEGFVIDFLDELSKLLDFTYSIHIVYDAQYGKQVEDGKWNGMVGEVIDRVADFAVADLSITQSRIEAVDFTLPFMQTGIGIIFKKPTEKEISLFSFLLPFSGDVWLLIIAAYIFISILLFVVGRMSPYEWSNPYPCRDGDQVEGNVFSLLNSMWWAIGSLLQQGSDVSPSASSTRALTSMWSFFRLIMISSYTANLAAFLTVEKLVSPINNVEDLAKQEKIKYGCMRDGSTHKFFTQSTIQPYKKMSEFMKKHESEVFVGSNEDGIRKIKKGNYAYFMEGVIIEYNIERDCDLTQVGDLLDSKGYGIAVEKGNSNLRDWLSKGILQLQEEGRLRVLKERWWKEKKGGGKCQAATSSGVNELGLKNVGGVILVLNLGLCLSAIVGVVEFFWYQRKIRRTAKKSTCHLFLQEVKYAVTCGSSSKPAPKLKNKGESIEDKSGYKTLS